MMRFIIIVLIATFASPAIADDFARIADRGVFVNLISGKRLTSFGVSLTVNPSGSIGGRAFGRDISGNWTWDGGYFCRTMKAGDTLFERNCQVVQQKDGRIRFIADKGTGSIADLRLQ
jgi:hypothetical protein